MSKNPFEQYRAFCAWLVSAPEEVAISQLWKSLREAGDDNMAYYLADYYKVVDLSPEAILHKLKADALNYDIGGFSSLGTKQ